MSDVERPANGGGKPGNGGHPGPAAHGLPVRNMADIARLFLEGARPLPTRVPPGRRAPPPPPQPVETPPPKPADQLPEENATAVLGLAGAASEPHAWRLLIQAAQGLAQEQATAVAVVGLLPNGSKTSFIVDVVGVESMEELPVVRTAQEAATGDSAVASDLQIARALHRLRPAVGLWILSAPPCDARTFPAVASIVREWLLACPTDNDGLIGGYRYLKKAWTRAAAGRDLRLSPSVYLLSEDYDQAAQVHKRLRKAVQEFLGADLALAGAGPIRRAVGGVPIAQEPIRVLSVGCDGPQDALWAAVLDELCPVTSQQPSEPNEVETALDHVENHATHVADSSIKNSALMLDGLAQVLDPEERAALAASFDEPQTPAPPPSPAPRQMQLPEEAPAPLAPSRAEPPAIAADPAVVKPTIVIPPASHPEPLPQSTAVAPAVPVLPPPPMPVPPVLPPAPGTRQPPIEDRTSKMEHPGASAVENGFLPTLRVFDADGALDRPSQWQAVEGSIGDLAPRSTLLDARPPMAWAAETCLAVDAAGRINVWMLYREGVSWFALREWTQEHRQLLALTRRDLPVDTAADVALHIVLPLENDEAAARRAADAVNLLRRIPSSCARLYRLRTVQWNGRLGAMVVPLS